VSGIRTVVRSLMPSLAEVWHSGRSGIGALVPGGSIRKSPQPPSEQLVVVRLEKWLGCSGRFPQLVYRHARLLTRGIRCCALEMRLRWNEEPS
jgi:hypothetical protein